LTSSTLPETGLMTGDVALWILSRRARSLRPPRFPPRDVDVHDIAELLLGEVGDADRRVLAFNADPRVLAVIFDVSGFIVATSA